MTNCEAQEYVEQVLRYLKEDLESYEKAKTETTRIGAGPYLLTTSSGIDFLGSLGVPEEELNPKAKKAVGLNLKS